MDHLSRLILLALVALFPSVSFAWVQGGTTCFESGNKASASTSWYATHEGACAAAILVMSGSGTTYNYTVTSCAFDANATKTRVGYSRVNIATGAVSTGSSLLQKRTATNQSQCLIDSAPPPSTFDCQSLANVKTLGSANDQPDTFSPGDTICVKSGKVGGATTAMNCAAFKSAKQTFKRLGPSGARDWLVAYQFTGMACDAEPEMTQIQPVDTDNDSEKCKTGAGGLTWCESPQKDADCGFFNDKYVCLKSLGTDKCQTKADGSRLCVSTAPTPPVPDNGTPGVKAAPSDTMQARDPTTNITTTYNFYNSTVNAGSGRDTGNGGNADGSGTVDAGGASTGDGTGTGTSEDPTADDSASGGLQCDEPPNCEGDPIQCALLTQQWKTRCPDGITPAEALEAFGATAEETAGTVPGTTVDVTALNGDGPISVGSCPAPLGISVMGQSISLDIWKYGCDLALLFAPFVMTMAWFSAAMMLVRSVW